MEILVLNRQRRRKVDARDLADFARRVAAGAGLSDAGFTVCLVSDAKMQAYNATYRDIHSPTDVLSFPDDPGADGYLGDIVISVETASRQAAAEGHSLPRELEILTLHGYLHLLGHDHETDDGSMMRLQHRLVGEYCRGE